MTVPASQLDFSEMQDNAGKACGLLKAMANEARLMVLCQLIEGERSVTELQEAPARHAARAQVGTQCL